MTIISDYVSRMVAAGMEPGEAMQIAAELFAAGAASAATRPSAGALRTRKWRHKTSHNVTCDTQSAMPESVTKRHETSQSVTSDNTPLSSSNLDLRKKRERGSRIAPDWKPDRDFAKHLGWSEFQIDAEEANFRDYWLGCAGSKGVKLDWAATWRKWIRNSRTKPAGNVLTASQVVDVNWDDVLARFKKMGHWSKWAGPDPSSAACRAPAELLAKYGIGPVAEVSRPPPAPLLRAM